LNHSAVPFVDSAVDDSRDSDAVGAVFATLRRVSRL